MSGKRRNRGTGTPCKAAPVCIDELVSQEHLFRRGLRRAAKLKPIPGPRQCPVGGHRLPVEAMLAALTSTSELKFLPWTFTNPSI